MRSISNDGEDLRKATFVVTADLNEATCTRDVVDLETVGIIVGADLLKPPYQGNHQKC